MIEFRDALKQYFEENDVNISNLAKASGLDRTVIQHMVGNRKDYRLPSAESLKVVLSHLRMTPSDKKYIEELFTIERIGSYNYYTRKSVKRIIESISELHQADFSPAALTPKSSSTLIDDKETLFKGPNAVNGILQWLCLEQVSRSDHPQVCLNIPFTHDFLKQMILQLYWEHNGRFEIKHIVTLLKNPRNEPKRNANLDLIDNILPFAFCVGQGYSARYYYTNLDAGNEPLLLMPYYLLTKDKLLLVSGDFHSAILITDLQLIHEYRCMFEVHYTQCQNLIGHVGNPLEIFDAYATCIADNCVAYSIESYPCFFQHITDDMIERTGRYDNPENIPIIQGFSEYLKVFSKIDIADYFSMEGLNHFTQNGRIKALAEQHANAFSIEDRLLLLRSLHKKIQDGGRTRLIDSSKIFLSDKSLVSVINGTLQFYFCNGEGFHYCIINESSIVSAFEDFLKSLADNEILFSKEETLSVLEQHISILENRLQNSMKCMD